MTNYGTTYASVRPNEIEITQNKVFVASNIQEYTSHDEDGNVVQGYQYDFIEYEKDEYIQKMTQSISSLEDELQAAKIILGVE